MHDSNLILIVRPDCTRGEGELEGSRVVIDHCGKGFGAEMKRTDPKGRKRERELERSNPSYRARLFNSKALSLTRRDDAVARCNFREASNMYT